MPDRIVVTSPITANRIVVSPAQTKVIAAYIQGPTGPQGPAGDADNLVTLDTTQTITGDKTFSGTMTVIAPVSDLNPATKAYVDQEVAGVVGATITAGAGLTKTGDVVDIVSASASRIVVAADSVDLATTGVTAGDYPFVTVDTYGRITTGSTTISSGIWNGSIIGQVYGGTGRDISGDADGTIYKKVGTELVAATAGTDYLTSSSDIDGGSF